MAITLREGLKREVLVGWQGGNERSPNNGVGILHFEVELLLRTVPCQPRREDLGFLHHSNKIPL